MFFTEVNVNKKLNYRVGGCVERSLMADSNKSNCQINMSHDFEEAQSPAVCEKNIFHLFRSSARGI
jgi:hypothetical protein